jgi:hypothetical protein
MIEEAGRRLGAIKAAARSGDDQLLPQHTFGPFWSIA